MTTTSGKVIGVNGSLVTASFDGPIGQNEVAYARLGDIRLMSEVIRVRGNEADLQVFEDTTGLAVGDTIEFSGELLTVELGPGLLTQIFDGLQNPLPRLAEQCGFFLQRGTYIEALPRDRKWTFTPAVRSGDTVSAAETVGHVPEGIFQHRIMVPFGLHGNAVVEWIAAPGDYTVTDSIARLKTAAGEVV